MGNPFVDESECIGCSACVAVCPYPCFEIKDGKAKVINADLCMDCKLCIEECDVFCITLD